ncbi:MAG: metal ABC transporter substrate-binding protein [Actinomycetota bacterium]
MFPRPFALVAPFVLAVFVLFPACGGDDSAEDPDGSASGSTQPCAMPAPIEGRPVVVATTVAPITSIVANIASGTDTVIEGIVPEGTNSHTYEPPPSVAAIVSDADVVFINGLVLEEPTKELALANKKDAGVICELGTAILPESDYVYDFSFPREGGKPNPHLWTNPPMAKAYAELVRDVLAAADPAAAATYAANFEAFAARIDALDSALRESTATLEADARQLLTYHDAYAYFAKEYGWNVIGAIQPSSFDEPTPKEIADLIDQVEKTGVRAIFGSEVFPSTVLEQIGKETGVDYVDVLRDDDLIGEPGDPEHSWMGLMRFDYVTMIEALGGDASALRALDVSDVGPDTAVYPQ